MRKPGAKTLFTTLLLVVVGAGAFAAHRVYGILTEWPARKALPGGAEVLEEHGNADMGDVDYYIRVRISKSDFKTWVERLGLKETAEMSVFDDGDDSDRCESTARYEEKTGEADLRVLCW
jgi:hypothetical protein